MASTVVTITATGAGSWTVPPHSGGVLVEVWGAGGGGLSTSWPGGGGAGGAYIRSTITVADGGTIFYNVGAGGASAGGASFAGDASTYAASANAIQAGGGAAGSTVAVSGGTGVSKGTYATGAVAYAGGNGTAPQGGGGSRGGTGGGGSGGPAGAGTFGALPSGANGTSGGTGNGGSIAGGIAGTGSVSGGTGTTTADGGGGGGGAAGGSTTSFGGNGGLGGGGGGAGSSISSRGGSGGSGQIRFTYDPPTSIPVSVSVTGQAVTASAGAAVPVASYTIKAPGAAYTGDEYDDGNTLIAGMSFCAFAPVTITAVRFWRTAGDGTYGSGGRSVAIYDAAGVAVATGMSASEPIFTDGWVTVPVSPPLVMTGAGIVPGYTAAVMRTKYVATTRYYEDTGYYSPGNKIYAYGNAESHANISLGNGSFVYSTTMQRPTESFNSGDYWVDIVYTFPEPNVSVTVTGAALTATPGSVGVTASGGAPWTPALITTGMAEWFDAADAAQLVFSGSNLTQWKDKSPAANHATPFATGPTLTSINGLGSLAFNSQNLKTTTAISFGDFTVMAVFRPGSGTDPGAAERILDHDYLNGWWLGQAVSVAAQQWGGGVRLGTDPYGYFVALADDQVHQISTRRTGSSQTVSGNGGAVITTNACSSAATTSNVIGIAGGFDNSAATDRLNDEVISEVLIWSRALTTDELQKTEGYLAWKWGIQSKLPAGHPYKDAAPVTGGGGVTVNITGAGLTATAGTATANGKARTNVTSTALGSTAGTVTFKGKASPGVTSTALGSAAGSVSVTIGAGNVSVPVTATGLTATPGTVSTVVGVGVSASVTGQQLATTAGAVTAVTTAPISVPVIGEAIAALPGSVTPLAATGVAVTGQALAAAAGTVTAEADVSVAVSGQALATSSGSVTTRGKAYAYASGEQLVVSRGSPTVVATIKGGVRLWDGTQWVMLPVKAWTGSAWQQKQVKTWTGSAWVAK